MKKLVFSMMIVAMAMVNVASADVAIGNPNAGNGWSSASAITTTCSEAQWGLNSITTVNGLGMDAATGTMMNNQINDPREYWDSQFVGTSGGNSEGPNPNLVGPQVSSCWILWTFDKPYELTTMHVWNMNRDIYTAGGINNCGIQYSLTGGTDPSEWKFAKAGGAFVGDEFFDPGHFQFPRASGLNDYTGFDAVDFEGALAKYVYLYVYDIAPAAPEGGDWDAPYGDVGLAEVRFYAVPEPATMLLLGLGALALRRRA